ncbi:MAG TPA: DUF3298 domain-containing protein [Candidatus Paceibacterota bacterium]|nr:DUF3298 domain-containing protein [Candidatus Paceibacterota bacterium]
MRKSIVFALLSIVLAAVVLLLVARAPMQSFTAPAQATVATSTITVSTTEYTVQADYPQFGIPAIDAKIKADVESGVSDLEKQALQDKPAENHFPTYTFDAQYSDAHIGPDFVSARLVLAAYTGGAHEMPVIIGENFHRDSGQIVTLQEALALTGKTLDQVAAAAKAQLAENPDTQPTGIWGPGSDSDPKNYATFLIQKDNVVFIFQPYQVAPYAAGTPEISIPRVK